MMHALQAEALCLSFVGLFLVAPADDPARGIAGVLSRLPHAQAQVGVCVIDLDSGSVLFERNPDRPFTPASTMKLFAMAAALRELGPEFHFETVLATNGSDLVVIGDGDPSFGDEKLALARKESWNTELTRWSGGLLELGVHSIPGKLVIDESVFDDQGVHPSWEHGDLDNWYAAPVGGLNINDNCVDISLRPGHAPDSPAMVSVQPPGSVVRIVNQVRTGASKAEPVLNHDFDSFEYRVSGRVNKPYRFGSVSFPDPGLLFADALRTTLRSRGIVADGVLERRRVRSADGALPDTLKIITKTRTPLSDTLQRAGKDSQNLFAECLIKRAGHAYASRRSAAHVSGSWENGAAVVMDVVTSAGITTDGLTVADGSGLSRTNSCTASQLAGLLAWSHRQSWGKTLHDNLAQAGVDGSLRKRLRNSEGGVFAKTGTMRGIRALAGYIDGDKRPRYAFAVMFNGYQGPSTPYKAIQDQICRILLDAADEDGNGRNAQRARR